MRVRNEVFAAKCSDKWMGFRSPVSCAKPTTSEEDTVLLNRSVMPTDRSSKNNVRSGCRFIAAFNSAGPIPASGPPLVAPPPDQPADGEQNHRGDCGDDAVLA